MPPVKPKFRISLTKDQVTELGRLSVIWGQLDHFTLMTVTKLIAADPPSGMIIMKQMTTGPLVGLLQKSLSRIGDTQTRKLAKDFCADMGPLIEYRNHVLHGMWGWLMTDGKAKNAKPACYYIKEPKREVFPDRITTTADRAAKLTHMIYGVVCKLYEMDKPGPGNPRYFFSKTMKLDLPKGLKLKSLE